MNVLMVICAGGWMPAHLSEGWRRCGWTVHEFFYGTHMGKDWSRAGREQNGRMNGELLRFARRLKSENRLDLLFAVVYDDVLDVDTAKSLRAMGIPMVNYHVDLIGQWYRVLRTGRYFDRLACAQMAHWPALERAGIKPYLMPMAANSSNMEEIHNEAGKEFHGVVYMGSPWPYRRQILGELAERGVTVRIYGHNWRRPDGLAVAHSRMHGTEQPIAKTLHDLKHYLAARIREEGVAAPVRALRARLSNPTRGAHKDSKALKAEIVGDYRTEDLPTLVRAADINLGFTHFNGKPGTPGETRQMRLRDFEIPMAGGFYLTQRCAEIGRMFDEDRNIVCWDGIEELASKIQYYLANPSLRRTIAEDGRRHCEQNHTWEHRFRDLLGELGIPAHSVAQ